MLSLATNFNDEFWGFDECEFLNITYLQSWNKTHLDTVKAVKTIK